MIQKFARKFLYPPVYRIGCFFWLDLDNTVDWEAHPRYERLLDRLWGW